MPVAVSSGPGERPRWSKDGGGIYFFADRKGLMAVDITTSPRISATPPRLILDLETAEALNLRYDTLPDDRLLLLQPGKAEGEITRYDVVLGWLDGLKEKVSKQVSVR